MSRVQVRGIWSVCTAPSEQDARKKIGASKLQPAPRVLASCPRRTLRRSCSFKSRFCGRYFAALQVLETIFTFSTVSVCDAAPALLGVAAEGEPAALVEPVI